MAPNAKLVGSMWTWTPNPILEQSKWEHLCKLLFWWSPKLFNILGSIQKNYLPQYFGKWGHDEGKIPNETLIKLDYAIVNLNVLGSFWWWNVDNWKKLFGSWQFAFVGYYVLQDDSWIHYKHAFFRVKANTTFPTFVKT